MAHMVTIRGTWSRSNTFRDEVYSWRRLLRRHVQQLGGSLEYVLPQAQKDTPGRNPGTKSGTFVATIPLREGWQSRAKKGQAALHILKAVLAMETCRPPTLRIDSERTTWQRNPDKVGVL